MITTAKAKSLTEQVSSSMHRSPFSREFAEVRISADGSDVCLTGKVSSYYHKQLATETCRQVSGVKAVSNRLDVEYPE